MKLLRLTPALIFGATMILMSGCSSNDPDITVKPNSDPIYLTFELTQQSDNKANKPCVQTRANLDKTEDEAKINSLVALLVDGEGDNAGIICAAVKANQEDIVLKEGTTGIYTVTLNMGMSSFYTREHTYRLHVYANMSGTLDTKLLNTVGTNISTVQKYTESMLLTLPGTELATSSLKYSTTEEEAAKVEVWLEKNEDGSEKEYPSTAPYIVKTSPDRSNNGTLVLTPLQARIDIVETSGFSNFTFPITTSLGTTDNALKVQFKKATFHNIAKKEYIVQNVSSSVVAIPELTVSNLYDSSPLSMVAGTIIYLPENVPAASGLTYEVAPYVELTGILIANNSTQVSSTVKTAITGSNHPSLYYYDDGIYQSELTTVANTGANWYKIDYDATLGGYKVTYRHAIQHNATDGVNLNDGIIKPMEYGVVRNFIYEIGVASVSSLPHPWSNTDSPEDGKKDINIKISTTPWTYHRGGFEINFE